MVTIGNFTWVMHINFDYVCECIQTGCCRKEGLKVGQLRKLYKLIWRYGSDEAISRTLSVLARYPKASKFFEKE